MTQEFRYSLTSICLRSGQLSLSQRMMEIFPPSGAVTALDTLSDDEFELEAVAPRQVSGMGDYFSRHRLAVNDTILLRKLPDGRIGFTAERRSARRGDDSTASDDRPVSRAAEAPAIRPVDRPLPGAAGERTGVSERVDPGQRLERRERSEENRVRRPTVTPYPRGVMFPGEAALNSKRPSGDMKSFNRAREALAVFGYRSEGLPRGLLLAKALLGRRQHSVLVRVLNQNERLDWAALLANRRDHAADYLAVFGDHRDLHRLAAPAELARATLWSWDGIARVQNLAKSVLIGPFELEPHFEKDGMLGAGLERFERTMERLAAERGALSTVITRLAALKAPAVFVLDDLADSELPRDQVAGILELLGKAPFQLVGKVDRGEYCLRHRVDDALSHLSEYALTLRERLPLERRERLAGESFEDSDEPAGEGAVEGSAGHVEITESV